MHRDQNSHILAGFQRVEDIFGYERGELVNKPIDILVPLDFKAPHPKFVKTYVDNTTMKVSVEAASFSGLHGF